MPTLKVTLATAALLALVIGCGQPPTITHENSNRFNQTAARSGAGYSLTIQQLYDHLDRTQKWPQGATLSASEVGDELDRLVVDTLAGLAADTVDLDAHYEYNRIYRQRYFDYLVRRFGQVELFDKVKVDSAEVDSYYVAYPEQFTRKEQALVRHILVTNYGMTLTEDSLRIRLMPQDSVELEAERYAWKLRGMLDEGQPFKDVARDFSHDSQARARAGHLGWVERGVYEDPFDSVAFSLTPGQYSTPYRSPSGWHIVLVEDYRPEDRAPLDSVVRARIDGHLRNQRAEVAARPLIDSLEKAMVLSINDAILDTNLLLLPKQLWAAVVNGVDTIECADLQMLEDGYRRRHKIDNTTNEMKHEIVRAAARRFVVIQAARAAKTDTLPDVVEQERSLRHQYKKRVYMLASRDDSWTPSDSQIAEYYQAHIANYEIAKPYVVQHIIAADSSVAEFLRDQALAGADFLELADEYYPGEKSLRRELANLGEIGPNDVSPEFYETARITAVGSVSRPVKTQYGWHIVKVLEHRLPLTLEQARSKIVPILKQEHERAVFHAFRDRLYREYDVSRTDRLYPFVIRPLSERAAAADQPTAAEPALEAPDAQ